VQPAALLLWSLLAVTQCCSDTAVTDFGVLRKSSEIQKSMILFEMCHFEGKYQQ